MYVPVAFDQLKEFLVEEGSKAIPVLNHWEKYLVRGYTHPTTGVYHGPDWSIPEWNVYRETIMGERRTTNDTESWHRRLAAVILKSHPTVESFCNDLMEEWGFISTMIEMVLAGAEKRDLVKMIDKKAVKRKEAILNVVETGEDCKDILEYLENIGLVV